MLLIFLVPLSKHAKEIKSKVGSQIDGSTTTTKLDRVIRRNIVFSLIALTSGFVALTILAILEWIANEIQSHAGDYLRVWASFTIAFDVSRQNETNKGPSL